MPSNAVLVILYRGLGGALGLLSSLGFVGLAAEIDFSHTITLGSVLVAFVVLAIAGIFTLRSKIANVWRQEAEGERALRERAQEELNNARQERQSFEREQQELRHALKNEVVGLKAQIKVLESRTDLSSALDAIRDIGDHGTAVSRELVAVIKSWNDLSVERDNETHQLLKEIRDKLPTTPVAVEAAGGVLPVHEVERRHQE